MTTIINSNLSLINLIFIYSVEMGISNELTALEICEQQPLTVHDPEEIIFPYTTSVYRSLNEIDNTSFVMYIEQCAREYMESVETIIEEPM